MSTHELIYLFMYIISLTQTATKHLYFACLHIPKRNITHKLTLQIKTISHHRKWLVDNTYEYAENRLYLSVSGWVFSQSCFGIKTRRHFTEDVSGNCLEYFVIWFPSTWRRPRLKQQIFRWSNFENNLGHQCCYWPAASFARQCSTHELGFVNQREACFEQWESGKTSELAWNDGTKQMNEMKLR